MLPSHPRLARALATLTLVSILGGGFATACSTASTKKNARRLASDGAPLTLEQLKAFEESGIGILSNAVLANQISSETKLNAELKIELDKLGGREETLGMKSLYVGIGMAGGAMAGYVYGVLMDFDDSSRDAISRGGAGPTSGEELGMPSLKNTGAFALVGAVAMGGAYASSQSTNLSMVNENREKADAVTQEKKAGIAAARLAFETETRAIASRYARIFAIRASDSENLLREIQTRAIEEGKRPVNQGSAIRLDVPEIMAEARIISEQDHKNFKQAVATLQNVTPDETTLRQAGNAKNFGQNLEIAKAVLREYADWLAKARAQLIAAPMAQRDSIAIRKVEKAIANTKRLNEWLSER